NTGTITVPNLTISAVNTVALNQANDVTTGNLMAAVSGNAQAFVFIDKNSLTLGATGAGNAISTNGGPVIVTTLDGDLTVNNDIQAGSADITLTTGGTHHLFSNHAIIAPGGGKTITIVGDQQALGASPTSSITAFGGGRVILREFSGGKPINLGTAGDPSGSLNLTNDELNTVSTTGVLQVAAGALDDVSVTDAINLLNVGTLTIFVPGAISNTTRGSLSGPSAARGP